MIAQKTKVFFSKYAKNTLSKRPFFKRISKTKKNRFSKKNVKFYIFYIKNLHITKLNNNFATLKRNNND